MIYWLLRLVVLSDLMGRLRILLSDLVGRLRILLRVIARRLLVIIIRTVRLLMHTWRRIEVRAIRSL